MTPPSTAPASNTHSGQRGLGFGAGAGVLGRWFNWLGGPGRTGVDRCLVLAS